MISYILSTLEHLMQKASHLKSQVEQTPHDSYQQLKLLCLDILDQTQNELENKINMVKVLKESRPQVVVDSGLKAIKKANTSLMNIENIAMLTLSKSTPQDTVLHDLIEDMLSEINYPKPYPSISLLSTSSYVAYPTFNLIQLPMYEQNHLLHLPDIFHEIGHLLIRNAQGQNSMVLKKIQKRINDRVLKVYDRAIKEYTRVKRHPLLIYRTNEWKEWWWQNWVEEFMCDVLATVITGPAYGWSAIHLHAKRGTDPYDCGIETHPADHARMHMILYTLRASGHTTEAQAIEEMWNELIQNLHATENPDYVHCFPSTLLDAVAGEIVEGLKNMDITFVPASGQINLIRLLNAAWSTFWRDPSVYNNWEAGILQELKAKVVIKKY